MHILKKWKKKVKKSHKTGFSSMLGVEEIVKANKVFDSMLGTQAKVSLVPVLVRPGAFLNAMHCNVLYTKLSAVTAGRSTRSRQILYPARVRGQNANAESNLDGSGQGAGYNRTVPSVKDLIVIKKADR